MGKPSSFPKEVHERAVRLVFEHQDSHSSQWSAVSSVAAKIGSTPEKLRRWVRQTERDDCKRSGPTTSEQERIKALERQARSVMSTLGATQ
jgi:transposase